MKAFPHTFRIFLIIALCLNLQVQARWATLEDAAIIREFYNSNIVVRPDGTNTNTIEFQEVIAKESARPYAAGYTLSYNKDTTKLTILSAKTIVDGVEYEVAADKIEDKPLASSPLGFDQSHQVLISFPNVNVGAKIYLKYRLEDEKVAIPGAFTCDNYFGTGRNATYWEKASVNIESAIPLYLNVNDPDEALAVKVTGAGATAGAGASASAAAEPLHTLSVDLIKPVIKTPMHEPVKSVLNPKHYCYFSVSSLDSWAQLAAKFSGGYAAVMAQVLPPKLMGVFEEAQRKEGDIAQINEVTSLLNSEVHYMGDWKSIAGRYIPRDLDVIDRAGLGDCKDFTASTGAILKRMGYEVQPALVWRGTAYVQYKLATLRAFNHVLLKVTGKDGRIYWVDPTNAVSMAQGVFPDVSGKMALVLDPKSGVYEPIPETSPDSSMHESESFMEVKEGNILSVSGTISQKGEVVYATGLCGAERSLSRQNIAEQLYLSISGTSLEPHEKKLLELPPDLRSPIVRDIIVKYAYDNPRGGHKSNLGVIIHLKADALDDLLNYVPDQVQDLLLSSPWKKIERKRIKNGPIARIEDLNYAVRTPWVEVERVCRNIGTESEIITTISFLQRYIPAEALNSKVYQDLKKSLEWNMKMVSLVLDPSTIA